MKRWQRLVLIISVGGLLAFGAAQFIVSSVIKWAPRRIPGMMEAKNLHSWLTTYAVHHEGRLPERLEDLKTANAGVPDDFDRYFSEVLEYRGGGLLLRELPDDFLLLRYRAGRDRDQVARVTARGSIVAKKED